MSDKRPELNDIYRESSVAEETTTPVKLAETIQQNLRRQFFINLAIGTVSLLLFMAVLLLILSELRMNAGEAETVPRLQAAYVPTFSLPENERWVLDYRQAAAQQEEIVPTNGCPVSTKWVKSAAYHFIMGEQSLMMNDPETAQVHLEKALHIFPAMTGIHRALGTAYLHQKKFEQAADELELALNEGVSVNLLVNLGVA
ncbi:MAG: tetratricopeptide repeat protein, partial [Kiritimatiellales bacterium]